MQVLILMHFSELCLVAKNLGRRRGVLAEMLGVEISGVCMVELSLALLTSSAVDSTSVVSVIGIAAFLPVGRS